MFGKIFGSAYNNTFGARAQEVGATFAFMWFWVLLFSLILSLTVGSVSSIDSGDGLLLGVIPNYLLQGWHMDTKEAISSGLGWQLVTACITAPFLEEIVFRGVFCSVSSDRSGKLYHWSWAVILLGTFIGFGLAHRNGLYSIMVQGVIGLFLARLWFRNGPNQTASYLSCVAAHSCYNFSVVAITFIF